MYHGTPAERAELRRTAMRAPDDTSGATSTPEEEVMIKKGPRGRGKGKKAPVRKAPAPKRTAKGRPTKKRKIESDDEDDETSDMDDDTRIPTTDTLPPQTRATFPVVITTYEMILKDRAFLCAYNWGYIVVDEGHRL